MKLFKSHFSGHPEKLNFKKNSSPYEKKSSWLMESQVRFCSLQNISGASQKKQCCSIHLNNWRRWALGNVQKRKSNLWNTRYPKMIGKDCIYTFNAQTGCVLSLSSGSESANTAFANRFGISGLVFQSYFSLGGCCTLLCCEAPGMFCVLRFYTQLSTSK